MNPGISGDNINLQALLTLNALQQQMFLLLNAAQPVLPVVPPTFAGAQDFSLLLSRVDPANPFVLGRHALLSRKRKSGEPVQPKVVRCFNRDVPQDVAIDVKGAQDDGDAFVCRTCNHKLKTKTNLTRHMKKHTGEKPFSCNYCRLRFAESTALKRHLRTHTGEKPCVCHYEGCSKAFADVSNLRRHIMTHTGEKPFQCRSPDCPRHFSRRSSLKTHMLCIHSMTLAEDDTGEALSSLPQDDNPRPRKYRTRRPASPASPNTSGSSTWEESSQSSGSDVEALDVLAGLAATKNE
jgi:uncharacterized Zn-finger protein